MEISKYARTVFVFAFDSLLDSPHVVFTVYRDGEYAYEIIMHMTTPAMASSEHRWERAGLYRSILYSALGVEQ